MAKITYRLAPEDYRAWLEFIDSGIKRRRKESHYQELSLYLFAIGIGLWVSVANQEGFAACILVVLASYQLWRIGPFDKAWKALMHTYEREVIAHQYEFDISDEGLQQNCDGVETRVAWRLVEGFSKDDLRVMIRFHRRSGFVVPIPFFQTEMLDGLVNQMRKHHVPEESLGNR